MVSPYSCLDAVDLEKVTMRNRKESIYVALKNGQNLHIETKKTIELTIFKKSTNTVGDKKTLD